jgi:hypothetical protein
MHNTKEKAFTKVYIRTLITRYVNHREWLYDNCKSFKTIDQLQAICKIRTRLAANENSNLETHCRMILNLEEHLRKILPGVTSKFYCSRAQMIDALISNCKHFLHAK